MAKYSEAQKKAVLKYQKANYDCINLRYKKGYRDLVKQYADDAGVSVNAFVKIAIDEKIERTQKDNAKKL